MALGDFLHNWGFLVFGQECNGWWVYLWWHEIHKIWIKTQVAQKLNRTLECPVILKCQQIRVKYYYLYTYWDFEGWINKLTRATFASMNRDISERSWTKDGFISRWWRKSYPPKQKQKQCEENKLNLSYLLPGLIFWLRWKLWDFSDSIILPEVVVLWFWNLACSL